MYYFISNMTFQFASAIVFMTCFPYFQSFFSFFNHYLSVEGTCCEAPFNMSTLQTGETLGQV